MSEDQKTARELLKASENYFGIGYNMSTPNTKNVDEIWKKFIMLISLEINKPFPFLHILKEAKIISQEAFENYKREAASNPQNIDETIYNMLENLEFSELTYGKVFCKENLDVYQGLQPIYTNLKNEFQHAENRSASEQNTNPVSSTGNELLQHAENKSASEQRSSSKISTGNEQGQSFNPSGFGGRGQPVDESEDAVAGPFGQEKPAGSDVTTVATGAPGPAGKRVQKQKHQNSNILERMYKMGKLDVRCGKAKGFLFKNKFAEGVSSKCIKDDRGNWFTVGEFEKQGGRGNQKNWKKSIHCNRFQLKALIENGCLRNPSRTSPKKKKWDIKPVSCKGKEMTAAEPFGTDCQEEVIPWLKTLAAWLEEQLKHQSEELQKLFDSSKMISYSIQQLRGTIQSIDA
ncbi:PREDICTED: nuclear body protein SP140-like protein [Gekko japonicus]|uniref:Nuclear body protein SP140-like protein n=1 Tax=Gekko japonicus TaxID=146911 RepID=A0ABM1L8N8_GEKJA|nr:PREDICTED: nuclear body protein SP140-like protein [Gekko japonicus]